MFQLYALKTGLQTDLFTILGDLSQGIHGYRGINDWEEVCTEVFSSGNCQIKTLRQSYRTTIQIMELANEIIKQSDQTGLILAEPVVRHGMKPHVIATDDYQELAQYLIWQMGQLKEEGLQSMAIIGKTKEECQNIYHHLKKESGLKIKLLLGEEDMSGADAVIVPSYIVKGLEFDVVFIASIEYPYTKEELDLKLLYVAMTRPLHRLFICRRYGNLPLLDSAGPQCYDIIE